MSNELKTGLNKVEIIGVAKENKLKEGKGECGNYINGSLIVKTGEFSTVELNVFVNETTKKGKKDVRYNFLKQILDGELKTLADGVSEEEAVKVNVWADNPKFSARFEEDIFKPKNSNKAIAKTKIDLGFGKIVADEKIKPEDYIAKFDVDMFIDKIKEEVKDDEETGRVIIAGYVPVYGGKVIPIEVVAGVVEDKDGNEFDFANQIRRDLDEKTSLNIWGKIDFQEIIIKKKKGGKLGLARIEEEKKYVSDLVAVGGDEPTVEFDEELITKALAEREISIKEVESKDNKGAGLKTRVASAKTKVKINPNDIPF